MQQFALDFAPGLSDKYPRWEDTLNHAVYSSRLGLNGVAARLDQSPSDLCKRLAGEETRPLRARDAIRIIEETGDMTPVFWLIDKFIKDPEARKQEAMAQIPALVAQLESLLKTAGDGKVSSLRRA